jgi:hypothetical protein
MKAKLSPIIPLLLILLSGCAALGLETPKTFNERAAYVHSGINGVVSATTNSLNAGAIKSDDAVYVRDSAVRTRTFLGTAETAYGVGDIKTAEGRLALAEGVLRELQKHVGVKP